jgi:hypothetical protein
MPHPTPPHAHRLPERPLLLELRPRLRLLLLLRLLRLRLLLEVLRPLRLLLVLRPRLLLLLGLRPRRLGGERASLPRPLPRRTGL